MVLASSIALGFLMHPSSLFVLGALLLGWVYMFAVRTGPLVVNGRELRCAAAAQAAAAAACSRGLRRMGAVWQRSVKAA